MQPFPLRMVDVLEEDASVPRLLEGAGACAPFDELTIPALERRFVEGAVRPDMLSVTRNGQYLPPEEFALQYAEQGAMPAVVDSARLHGALEAGCSMELKGWDHWTPRLAEVTNALRERTGRPVLAQGFYTPAGRSGLPFHTDVFDVLAVQLDGEKAWEVHPQLDGPVRQRVVRPDELAEPAVRCTLRPGDVLYVPAGCPHVAEAATTSLHLSIGFRLLTVTDLVTAYLRDTEALPAPLRRRLGYGEDAQTLVKEALGALAESVESLTAEEIYALARGRHVEFWQPGTMRAM